MKYAVLDAEMLMDKWDLHDQLARLLDFPDWYGRNLEALRDCAGGIGEDVTLVIKNSRRLDAVLGPYGGKLMAALRTAQERNPHFHLALRESHAQC